MSDLHSWLYQGDTLSAEASKTFIYTKQRRGVGGWHSRERVVSNLLAIKAGLPGPQQGPVLLVG